MESNIFLPRNMEPLLKLPTGVRTRIRKVQVTGSWCGSWGLIMGTDHGVGTWAQLLKLESSARDHDATARTHVGDLEGASRGLIVWPHKQKGQLICRLASVFSRSCSPT